ncbi:MAG: VOC family protein [Candidatus Rokubacteria bacterium]|nr:VOC family protein [Candidatus Rokubacteria bacterium]
MNIRRIEHVAIAVRDVDAGRAFWEGVLGLHLAGEEEIASAQVRIGLYRVGESSVELIAGTAPGSAYEQLVRERGEVLHHLCFEVDDIEGALGELRAKGVKLRDEVPRAGHQGSRIAFIDPASTGQVLIELMELARMRGSDAWPSSRST